MAAKRKFDENLETRAMVLQGHSRPVRMIKFSEDGDLLFSASDDKNICLWRTFDGEKIGVYPGTSACKSIAVTRDVKFLFGAFVAEGFKVFICETGEEVS